MGQFRIILFLSLVIGQLSFGTVRYVSHSGSNTPPYLTWETAADSIMFAINISSFGDTIFVANGVYEEQVVMIPGLSLIGAGMDSCVIDTRALVNSNGFISVDVADSCLFKGFQILVCNNTSQGYGIAVRGNDSILQNKIETSWYGIYTGYTGTKTPYIYENLIVDVDIGIRLFNTNAIIRKNNIYIDPGAQSAIVAGILVEAFDFTYHPLIDSNYIELNGFSYTSAEGIHKSYGTRLSVLNNTIIVKGAQNKGISYGDSDSGLVANNLIYAESGIYGIYNAATQYLKIVNNYIVGNFNYPEFWALQVTSYDIVENNVVIGAARGVRATGTNNLIFKYNNVWNNGENYYGFNPDTTNISVNPMVVNTDTSQGELDFHLQKYSPLIDAGDPDILDKDGSRSDIGLYGGPFGEIYQYQDLPPRVPVNLSASFLLDTTRLLLKWNRNNEADFSHYNLFRDTTENFTADSTTFVASAADTFYISIVPQNTENLYFRLTAVDNQGNESEPSEELHVQLTGTINNEQFTINNYKLFQNYPNPFNPTTKIGYRLKERGYVKLYVYDIKGELVEVLVNGLQERGYYEVEFEGEVKGQKSDPPAGEAGVKSRFASGVYIYQIMVKSENSIPIFSDIKKMILLK